MKSLRAAAERPLFWALAAGAAAFLLFLPTVEFGFLNWDDDKNFLANAAWRGLGPAQLRWMFTSFHMGHYIPVTWLTLGLDHGLWGMNPGGYHLTNALLHGANAALAVAAALALWRAAAPGGAARGAWALWAALMWAAHPLRAESVAWITERRDLVCAFFALASLLFHLRACADPAGGRRARAASWLLFAAAAFAKPIVVGFPLVLLALDVWPLRRAAPGPVFTRANARLVAEKLPYFAISVAAGAAAVMATAAIGQFRGLAEHSLPHRLAQASFGASFLLLKTLVPTSLAPLYGFPPRESPWETQFFASAAAVAALTALTWKKRHEWPGLAAAWTAFLLLLAPTLGVAEAQSRTQDRYAYLAGLAWPLLAGGALALRFERDPRGRRAAGAAAAALCALFAWSAARQAEHWRSSTALWTRAVQSDPTLHVARYNLGAALAEEGKIAEAAASYEAAVKIFPGYARAHGAWGEALAALGRREEAAARFQEALRLDPAAAGPRHGLARLAMDAGDLAAARRGFENALRADPEHVPALADLGHVLALTGDDARAREMLAAALALRPALKEAQNDLGLIALRARDAEEALRRFDAALAIDPSFAEARVNFAGALAASGRPEAAENQFRRALADRPGLVEAHYNLGLLLEARGKNDEAAAHFRRCLELNPAFGPARERERKINRLNPK